jgi:hypothetical protein
VRSWTVGVEGGWRVFSSGAGIAVRLVRERLLGVRLRRSSIGIDPVLPLALDELTARVEIAGRSVGRQDEENGEEQDEDEGRVANQYGCTQRVHRIRSVTHERKCNATRMAPAITKTDTKAMPRSHNHRDHQSSSIIMSLTRARLAGMFNLVNDADVEGLVCQEETALFREFGQAPCGGRTWHRV